MIADNVDHAQSADRTDLATTPYYEDESVVLYHGNAAEIMPTIGPVGLLLSDPPYPNGAGHFEDGIEAAREVLMAVQAPSLMVFWDERETPKTALPLVAKHIWHRTNTNRPDNYEAIYHFSQDGIRRPSRVLPFAVIAKGLTGCKEATDHPTQKNIKLMRKLIEMSKSEGTILDPFVGSGTTLRAAKDLGRKAIGIEIDERWCEVAASRMAQEVLAI